MENNLTLKQIADAVIKVSKVNIRNRVRDNEHCIPRMIYYKIAKDNTLLTLKKIGNEVNIKAHGTVLSGICNFKTDIKNSFTKRLYDNILNELGLNDIYLEKEIKINDDEIRECEILVLNQLKDVNDEDVLEFIETRLKPFKKALESRIKPKVIVKVAGATLNR